MTPGQRVALQVNARLDQYRFYVSCLTGPERSLLAARCLLRVPERYRWQLLGSISIDQLAFCEVFHVENYGW